MIAVRDLTVQLGGFALKQISFEVRSGEYVALQGRTGSGKTTLVEALCGLRPIHHGSIELGGRDVTRLRPAERGVGYVPQDGALFPSMSVYEHLAFAMRIRRIAEPAIRQRVAELAAMLGIAPLLERKPKGLSGGEAQRVALGRAIAIKPEILCLDEPLSALDQETHRSMCDLLKAVCCQAGITALHVTHNPEEIRRLADRVLVLEAGRLVAPPVAASLAVGQECAR